MKKSALNVITAIVLVAQRKVIEAEGKKQIIVIDAEGKKQADIIKAEGEKAARIIDGKTPLLGLPD